MPGCSSHPRPAQASRSQHKTSRRAGCCIHRWCGGQCDARGKSPSAHQWPPHDALVEGRVDVGVHGRLWLFPLLALAPNAIERSVRGPRLQTSTISLNLSAQLRSKAWRTLLGGSPQPLHLTRLTLRQTAPVQHAMQPKGRQTIPANPGPRARLLPRCGSVVVAADDSRNMCLLSGMQSEESREGAAHIDLSQAAQVDVLEVGGSAGAAVLRATLAPPRIRAVGDAAHQAVRNDRRGQRGAVAVACSASTQILAQFTTASCHSWKPSVGIQHLQWKCVESEADARTVSAHYPGAGHM